MRRGPEGQADPVQEGAVFTGKSKRHAEGERGVRGRLSDHCGLSGSPYRLKGDAYSSHSVIVSRVGEGRGRRLLDVGAADGFLAQRFTEQGYEVTCIEGDPELAAVAASKCRRVVVADLDRDTPELDGRFDVIVYGDVLEHLKNPLRVLLWLNRHLSPDGVVIVSVPNVAHLWIRLQLLLGRFEDADRGIMDRSHLRFFTLASFRRFLAEANLTVVELVPTPVPLPLVVPERYHGRWLTVIHAMNAALARAWKTLLAYQFVAVTRRRALP